jgi:hypothetical protein
MAQKVVVEIVDDLDGSVSAEVTTVNFALDGRSYEIDLNASNAQKLRTSLAEFVAAGRRAKPRRGGAVVVRASSTHDSGARERAHAIREWASQAGHKVSDRGRIPAAVVEAYERAQREPSTPAPPTAEPVQPAAEPAQATETTSKKAPRKKAASKTKADPRKPSFSG